MGDRRDRFRLNSEKYFRYLRGESVVLDKKLARAMAAQVSSVAASIQRKIDAGNQNFSAEERFVYSQLYRDDGSQKQSRVYQASDFSPNVWTTPEFRARALDLLNKDLSGRYKPRPFQATSEITSFLGAPTRSKSREELLRLSSRNAGVRRYPQESVASMIPGYVRERQFTAPPALTGEALRLQVMKPKRPSVLMVPGPDGELAPIYTGFGSDVEAQINQILDERGLTGWQRWLAMFQFKLGRGVYKEGGLLWLLNEQSLKMEEMATQNIEDVTPGAALMQLAVNIIFSGVTGVLDNLLPGPGLFPLLSSADNQRADMIENAVLDGDQSMVSKLLRAEQALKPGGAEEEIARLRARAAYEKRVGEDLPLYYSRFVEGVKQSWDTLLHARGTGASPSRPLSPAERERMIQSQAAREAAADESAKYMAQSLSLADKINRMTPITGQDYVRIEEQKNRARDLMRNSIEAYRRSDPMDPLGAYSWSSEPERYEKFMTAVVDFQLQAGRQATVAEIRQIKDLHSNVWVEGVGQGIFDLTNLIPSAVLGVLFKPIKTVLKGAGAGLIKLPILRVLFAQSHTSVANEIVRTIYNLSLRIAKAYDNADDFVKVMDNISQVALEVRRAPSIKAAQAVFAAAKKEIGLRGLRNISFRNFQSYIDAGRNVDEVQWGVLIREAKDGVLQDAIEREVQYLKRFHKMDDIAARKSAQMLGPKMAELANNSGHIAEYLGAYSSKFGDAFLDLHRSFKGSRLLDDTLSGIVAKTASQAGAKGLAETIDFFVGVGMFAKSLWATAVLSLNPGYIVRNILDSAGRGAIYGGDFFGDISSIFSGVHSSFADAIGHIPLEFGQSLARAGLDFGDTVPTRMMFHDWKPGAGPFSYLAYEWGRLGMSDAKAAKALLDRMPTRVGRVFARMWNGFKSGARPLRAVAGGLADFNTSVEFTLRLRMFHREYFKLLSMLEPDFKLRSLENLSPQARRLAQQIWEASKSRPDQIVQEVDRILRIAGGDPWIHVLPEGFGKHLPPGAGARQIIDEIAAQTDNFVRTIYKRKGRIPNAQEVDKFVDSFIDGYTSEAQAVISQNNLARGVPGGINLDGKMSAVPGAENLQGSIPTPKPAIGVPASVKKLNRSFFQSSTGLMETYTEAMSGTAKVERVAGKEYRAFLRDGEIVAEIGDDLLKKRGPAFSDTLHNVTIEILKLWDTDYIQRMGFRPYTKDYDLALREFMVNPLKIRNTNEEIFMGLVTQMEHNPLIREILERTGKVASYDDALENFRMFGAVPNYVDMSRDEFVRYLKNNAAHRPSPARAIAGRDEAIARKNFGVASRSMSDPELRDKAARFLDETHKIRDTWNEDYLVNVSPGPYRPGRKSETGPAWELREQIMTESYIREKQMLDGLTELLKSDPKAAAARIDDILKDPASFYLGLNDIVLVRDPVSGRIISGTKIHNGEQIPLNWWERLGIERLFYLDGGTYKTNTAFVRKALTPDPAASLRKQFAHGLMDTMGLNQRQAGAIMRYIDDHAKHISGLANISIEDYYKRIGFVLVEDTGTLTKTGNTLDIAAKGIVRLEKDGSITFYGMGRSTVPDVIRESSKLFYSDIELLAKANADFRPVLEEIDKAIGRVPGTALTPEQQTRLADIMTRYFMEGVAEGKTHKPFNSYKNWMANLYDGIRETPLYDGLSPEVRAVLDKVFIGEQIKRPPKSSSRTAVAAAQAAGGQESDILRAINNAARKEIIPDSPSRVSFYKSIASIPGVTEEEVDTFSKVLDVRAQGWAAINDKSVDDWFKEHIADVKVGGKPVPTDLRQGDELIAVYRYTPHGEKPGQWGTTSGGMTLSRAGDSRVGGRTGTISVAYVTQSEMDQAKRAAIIENARPTRGTSGEDPREGFFQGMNITWLPEDTLPGGRLTTDIPDDLLFQGTKGGVSFLADGRAILHAFEGADISTVVHEVAHIFRRDLSGADLTTIEKWAGVQSGKWTRGAEEKFARAFEKFLADGIAPADDLKPVFEKFKIWLSKIYDGIVGSSIDITIPDDVRVVMNRLISPDKYTSIRDVLPDEMRTALKKLGLSTKIYDDLQLAWDTQKLSRMFDGFPATELETLEKAKKYLHVQMDAAPDSLADLYSARLWQVEQFESAILNSGSRAASDALFPAIKDFQMTEGIQTWMRNNDHLLSSFEGVLQEMDELRIYLKSGDYKTGLVPKDIAKELDVWKEIASTNKAELISTILDGGAVDGRKIEGAVDLVNRVMIDYNNQTRFDQIVKNFIPFWVFPSRTFPFWIETLMTHPQIIAGYLKLRRLSDSSRRQQGAVSSQGRPIPSLRGYLPIPGTDLWLNPLAPMSFSYVLGSFIQPEEFLYNLRNEADIPPQQWMAKNLQEFAQIYGFSVAPWIMWGVKKAMHISDDVMPPWTLTPQINLIPRFLIPDMIHIGNRISFPTYKDMWYPEVGWHDFLVERDLLEKTNQQIENLDDDRAFALVHDVAEAIKYHGDVPDTVSPEKAETYRRIWDDAYRATSSQESAQSWAGFMTGFYTKQFSDVEADLLALRNERNLLKSALNNRFQSALFELPLDAEEAWGAYNSVKDTPEGWLYRLYTDIGWVTNDRDSLIRDPKERAGVVAQRIMDEQNQSLYYQKAKEFADQRDRELRAAGVGASWETVRPIYEKYSSRMDGIRSLSSYDLKYGTSAPVELIQGRLRDEWFRMIWTLRPKWDIDNGETYDQYQKNLTEWENRIGMMPQLMGAFQRQSGIQDTLSALHPDQQLPPTFWTDLMAETNADGFLTWRRQNDSIFQALNSAWEELYWNPYWEAHRDASSESGWKSGYDYELATQAFLESHPAPPTSEQMYEWIATNYGGRFTLTEVRRWVEYEPDNVYSIQQRQIEEKGEEYLIRDEIWNMLSMAGPGKNRSLITDSLGTIERYGTLEDWYDSGGALFADDPEALLAFRDKLRTVIAGLELQPPTREELMQFAEAERLNRELEDFVLSKYNITDEAFDAARTAWLDDRSRGHGRLKAADPIAWQVMNDYYNKIRPIFASQNPIWAQYYLWKPDQPKNVSGLTPLTPPPLPQNIPESGTPATVIQAGGLGWPEGLREAVGADLAYIIEQAQLHDKYVLSYAAKAALKGFAANHPEWRDFIASILAKSP